MLAHGKHDLSIWEWAEKNAYTVVTADSDFVSMTQKLGWPPKVIHIEQSDFPFRGMKSDPDERRPYFGVRQKQRRRSSRSPIASSQPLTDSAINTVTAHLRQDSGCLYSGVICGAYGRFLEHF